MPAVDVVRVRATAASGLPRNRGLAARLPHTWFTVHADYIRQAATRELFPKVGALAVSRVDQDDVLLHAPPKRGVELSQRDLVLRRELHVVRDLRFLTALPVGAPLFWEVELQRDALTALFATEMQTGRHLAIVLSTQGARVLALHAHRVLPFLGESRVVDDQRLDAGEL